MSKEDIDELVCWRDKCEALAASLQRKVRHCDEITEERNQMERERDEARAEVQDYREQLRKLPDANRVASQDAYRRGAEAMREACAIRGGDKAYERMTKFWPLASEMKQVVRDAIRALPIPEEP